MLYLAGKGDNIEENKEKILENIQNGKALDKFKELVKNQGGDVSYIEDTSKFELAKYKMPVVSEIEGYVKEMKVERLGNISCMLGAGRVKKEDSINNKVGITVNKKVGDYIKKGDVIAIVYADDINIGNDAIEQIKSCYIVTDEKQEKLKSILGIIK